MRLLARNNLNIHEFAFADGRSALHHLADLEGSWERNYSDYDTNNIRGATMKLIQFFVKDPRKNYSDEHGYTYLHGACMAGHVKTIRRFIKEGVDVDLDRYECSPLHVAAQYRRNDVVKLLLKNGANPNQPDRERSTPLHALARLCLCECGDFYSFCDHRKPVDEIVDMLLKKGADIEARYCHGDTPLNLALSRFDVELARTLLKYGASLDNLEVHRLFVRNFQSIESINYPLTLNVIEVMELLRSAELRLDLDARLGMIKCWIRVRGDDIGHLTRSSSVWARAYMKYEKIVDRIYIHERFGFFISRRAMDDLREEINKLQLKLSIQASEYKPEPGIINEWENQVATLNDIKLIDDISLHRLCQMSYDKGYSIWKNMKNWRLPSLYFLEHSPLNLIVKRHVANILMRPYLELVVADIFMTDHCKLNLPYLACLKIAEYMTDEDLFRLCEHTNESDLKQLLSVRQSELSRVQDQNCQTDEEDISTPPAPKRQRLND
ncbi:unnamed protein product [Trichogramma brassicae]|uniref:Uncharacterized protein n=1 Tax=Trichogramma brassicae TaxID=86971 RepID=A0A6H5IPU4_9HYME|nr:unnamed protein product [Trichogramma brassicae]